MIQSDAFAVIAIGGDPEIVTAIGGLRGTHEIGFGGKHGDIVIVTAIGGASLGGKTQIDFGGKHEIATVIGGLGGRIEIDFGGKTEIDFAGNDFCPRLSLQC